MTISTTDFLNFLNKAQQISIYPEFIKCTDGYYIKLCYEWHSDNCFFDKTIFINNYGASSWSKGDETFDSMNDLLDTHIEREELKLVKAYKREQLIARLTDEEKELLGVK